VFPEPSPDVTPYVKFAFPGTAMDSASPDVELLDGNSGIGEVVDSGDTPVDDHPPGKDTSYGHRSLHMCQRKLSQLDVTKTRNKVSRGVSGHVCRNRAAISD